MKAATFRFATSILRRLGEELNPTMDQGVLELVKNSYDADATTCTVTLTQLEGEGGSVEILDDGTGMTPKEIIDGWLVLGASEKEGMTETPIFHRVPTGSKGLGRLACLRMGRRVTLVTRPASQPTQQYSLEIDWDKFDSARTVEAVTLDIQASKRGKEWLLLSEPGRFGTMPLSEHRKCPVCRALRPLERPARHDFTTRQCAVVPRALACYSY